MAPFKVIIIGAGLSGSLLANGLARYNVECKVFERSERNTKREGYQIRLGNPSLEGMRACLQKAHMQKIIDSFGRSSEQISDAPIICDTRFREILNLSKIPAYSKSAPISRALLRDILCQPLMDANVLQHGKQFSNYSIVNRLGTGGIRVNFTDGSWEECDILIGADGNQSKVNAQLGLNNIELLDSHIIMQSKCDLPDAARETLSPMLLNNSIGTSAGGVGYFFCVYESRTSNAVEVKDSQNKGSCMLGITLPVSILPPDFEQMSNDAKWDVIFMAYKDWSQEHRSTLELLRGQFLYSAWPRVGHRPAQNWREAAASKDDETAGHHRVWLMGDAIHPMLPNRGMGGNQAMRDTADALPLLVNLATQAKSGNSPSESEVREACEKYESLMIPRSYEWVKKSGGTAVSPFDLDKNLDWAVLSLSSWVIPLVQLAYYIANAFTPSKGKSLNELDEDG